MRRQPPSVNESPHLHPASGVGMMHDYTAKYGTLSGGSALSQSMRYAEPWLYASVSARSPGPRPSILTYPEPTVILGTPLLMCACKDFLSGTTRSKKSASAVCKKCGGSRKTYWNGNSSTAIRGFGTVRVSQPKSRPDLPTLEDLKDPYDMMRKSRLAAVSSTLRAEKHRAKSTSPSARTKTRSKSPPPRHKSPDIRLAGMKSPISNGIHDLNDPSGRKSILECDVNPYELITQYLKHEAPSSSKFYLDEEELSDNVIEENFSGKNRSKLRGFENNGPYIKVPYSNIRPKNSVLNELTTKPQKGLLQPDTGGVSIGGQRIRLFSTNDSVPSVSYVNEFVSDSDENVEEGEEEIYDLEKHKAWLASKKTSGSQTLRQSSSPKRPPRRLKPASDVEHCKNEYQKSTNEPGNRNRVNFALDVPTHSGRRSNSLTSSVSLEIKSILKKPNSTMNLTCGSAHPRPSLHSGVSKQEHMSKPALHSGVSKQEHMSNPALQNQTMKKSKNPSTNFRNATQQLQNRRKKQVQFNVKECLHSVYTQEEPVVGCTDGVPAQEPSAVATIEPRLQFFGDHRDDACAVNHAPQESEKNLQQRAESEEQAGRQNACGLQRSLSDCVSPGAEPGSKFNDTMRLRLRVARRDSRDVFSEDGRKQPERRVLSPGRPRPKEPPPPPPPPATGVSSTNDISTIESSIDQGRQQDNPDGCPIPPPPPPPRQIFPFTKEEIEHINQFREQNAGVRPRSSSNSPVRNSTDTSRRTSLTLPPLESNALWHQETSVVKDNITIDEIILDMEAFSSVTEVYEALEKNCKLNEEKEEEINNIEDKVVDSVKLIVPSALNNNSLLEENAEKKCTVITVSSPTQRVSLTKSKTLPNTKTSIMITGKNDDNYDRNIDEKVNKTSVLIGDFTPSHNNLESNKVTINVGGYNYQNDNKAGTNSPQTEEKNEFKSNIRIGSNDNKRTLLILEPSTAIDNIKSHTKDENAVIENNKAKKDISIDSKAEEEMNKLIRSNIDPVEAARQNIVPHICGLGKSVREESKDKQNRHTLNKLVSVEEEINIDNNMQVDGSDSIFNTLSSIESEENLDDDVFAIKDDTDENSDCYVCAKKKTAKDDEEIKIGIEFDSDENHYEVIIDPIYEEISDIPPPLPLSPPPSNINIPLSLPIRSIFEGASKYDILNYLETAKERGIVTEAEDDLEVKSAEESRISSLDLSSRISQLSNTSDSSEDSCNLVISAADTSSISSDKVRKNSVEIERNDSGVGSESSKCSRSRWQHLTVSQQHSCEDCEQPVETQVTDSGLMFAPLVCRKCAKRRSERREIISEIVETEEKYGRDLKIMLDEFYRPMLVAGLLTPDQLSAIFLNVEELLENNSMLAEKLRDALDIAIDQGDEDLLTVNIGSIFLDAVPMLHAFESYCTRQGTASLLLANLEKEKELLRIFLRVSQMDNSVLRRMNLNSFLMVPVQRVTKYPLLLARLYRVTPTHLKSRDTLRLAQAKIELHLEHINSLAKDISTTKLWRRISIINGRRSNSEIDMINIKLRKVAVDVLEWNHDEVRFAVEGKLLYTQPTDNNWRRGRTIKLSPVNAMLVTLGKPTEDYQPDTDELLAFPKKNGVRDATLVLVKEKSGRYGLLREPLFLERCIICCEADIEDYFEVQELATKDTYLFKAEDGEQTKRWFRQLQYHAQGLGAWRKRRNALANIMINGMQLRT